jgi:hypothetical protein
MQSRVPLNAEMFSDEAVYRRTTLGQRELLRSGGTLSTPGLRVLTRVNGFTDFGALSNLHQRTWARSPKPSGNWSRRT